MPHNREQNEAKGQSEARRDAPPRLDLDFSAPGALRLKLGGAWKISRRLPQAGAALEAPENQPAVKQIHFETAADFKWDSAFVVFLIRLLGLCRQRHIAVVEDGLPQNLRKFAATIKPTAEGAGKKPCQAARESFLATLGGRVLQMRSGLNAVFEFLGEVTLACGRLLAGKSTFRRREFFYILQTCGVDALMLVSLISVLVGIILAFVGAIQLTMFGAQIYIAHIVGIAMVRVMGAVMAGILMAGRTGASFAAELGIMQTNEEIDALRTLGVHPVDFLVIPRILALAIMMPMLTLYADLLGILGGMVICAGMFEINPMEYWEHTLQAVKLSNLWIGLVNGFVFGLIVALAGCYHGMKCERSAAGVGTATTSAVVSSITGIVIATAVITFICQILGIK